MEIDWGKNPEYSFMLWYDLTNWALPINISWVSNLDAVDNKYFYVALHFLCIGVAFEVWKWKKIKSQKGEYK